MKNRWLKIVCIGLALIFISSTAPACSLFGGGDNGGTTKPTTVVTTPVKITTPVSTEVPVVNIVRVAPNNLDLAGRTAAEMATPGEGALLVNESARLYVPPGAVAQSTPVIIKMLTENPAAMTSTIADAPQVTVVSPLYDFSPDNTRFDAPVEVTIAYSEDNLPAGADENNIGPVYYDGVNWVPIDRQIDTEKNTVSFETKSFPGSLFGLVYPTTLLGWAGTLVAGGVAAAVVGYCAVTTYNWLEQDPLYWNTARQYVTPEDPVVVQWAEKAQISLKAPGGVVYIKDLKDPKVLQSFLDSGEGMIQWENPKNINSPIKPKYDQNLLTDPWLTPKKYFNEAGLDSDCKNCANAMASVFRHFGYDARCVNGYQNGKRHGWVEVPIGDQVFYIGAYGEMMLLDVAVQSNKLTRKTTGDPSYTWDNNSQRPYKDRWWVTELRISVDSNKAYPGGKAVITVFGGLGRALNIELDVKDPNGVVSKDFGTTDKATGIYSKTLQFDNKAAPGRYSVAAESIAESLRGESVFVVQPVKITADTLTPQVAPGDTMIINVRLNLPLVTRVELLGLNSGDTTDSNGFAFFMRKIPEGAKPGPVSMIISAPEYNVSYTFRYTIVVPPSIKVDVQPKTVAPGTVLIVNVIVQPPAVTSITFRGFDGSLKTDKTDKDGFASPTISVSKDAKPGTYKITVEAPALGLSASDTYTVALAPTLPVNNSYAVRASLDIRVDGTTDEGEYEGEVSAGGDYVSATLEKNEIHASGRIMSEAGEGTIEYDFYLSADLNTITMGSVLFHADSGESYYYGFNNLPRNKDYEAVFKASQGLDAIIFAASGTAVTKYLSSFGIQSAETGSISRYYAEGDSSLVVYLVLAADEQ